jgi:hypothetical protein
MTSSERPTCRGGGRRVFVLSPVDRSGDAVEIDFPTFLHRMDRVRQPEDVVPISVERPRPVLTPGPRAAVRRPDLSPEPDYSEAFPQRIADEVLRGVEKADASARPMLTVQHSAPRRGRDHASATDSASASATMRRRSSATVVRAISWMPRSSAVEVVLLAVVQRHLAAGVAVAAAEGDPPLSAAVLPRDRDHGLGAADRTCDKPGARGGQLPDLSRGPPEEFADPRHDFDLPGTRGPRAAVVRRRTDRRPSAVLAARHDVRSSPRDP